MDTDRAKEIVKSLADGIDPDTGITFPSDSPYQRTDTVRALYAILEAAESGKKPKKPADPDKPRAGGRWTPEEDEKLRAAFHARKPNLYPAVFEDIAIDHGRTTGGITSRLVKLGLIEDKHTNRSGQAKRPEAATQLAPPTVNPSEESMPF
jgi:hypothetical protein